MTSKDEEQLEQARSRVLEIVAQALPFFGRDFTVDVTVVERRVRVGLKGLTPIGVALVPHLRDALNKELLHGGQSDRTEAHNDQQAG